ncbi:homocysteine S-methyltransferase [uncultured Dysosmobacter sp.]|uniref:homocysteine S-methyltransferase n=1 Tax=uncultured Dysosmobacter sp. TaxID=2591384 RepID=UPI00262AF307|nr:homocysteine S-methyltransferase [uncultured Dysosmobacter sp.]
MRVSLQETLKKTGVLVIDGSMSTLLEQLGCDLRDSLWTAKALAEQPELVREVHLRYFRAGADCGITCSYQATIPGLMNKGCSCEEAERMIVRSVELMLEARETWWADEGRAAGRAYPLCLAGVGPYGAYLADGSEYRGNYGISDQALKEFHRRRMELLWNAGADLLLIETQPSLKEAMIAAGIAESLGADYWISFVCKDGRHICEGDLLADCAKALAAERYPHLRMIGVNCTAPQLVERLIGELKTATGLPIAVYPNSGEVYDPVTKTWHGQRDGVTFGDYARRYIRAGASAVGGCCTTVESHVREVVKAREIVAKLGR